MNSASISQSTHPIAGRFKIEEYINQGGMGAVYRGVDTQTGQSVAIKQLRTDVSADPALVERFVREGDALRSLNHPNIVKMLAAEKQDSAYYLIMEYVEGGSLADLIAREGRLSIDRVLRIGLELSDALARAHYMRIIHRDLKPANVLLSRDGTPRLSDFGVARMGDSDMTGTGVIIGTFAYVPPEVINGEAVDARSDIWSFGVLLFELLTGKRPFEGDTAGTQMAAILTQRPPDIEALRPDAPIGLVDLIYRMLEKDRNQRITSMRLVGAELESIMSGGAPITPRPISGEATLQTPSITPTPTESAHHLPSQTTPFIGREAELEELQKLLTDPGIRLVTILGQGGIGKTRLSIEAASRLHFPQGIYFVSLAPLTSTESVLSAIADALKFQFNRATNNPVQQLIEFLQEKSLLLVMDNFEHLIASAPLMDTLLRECAGLKLLVTSRERLNLESETIVRIEGMDFPTWETPQDAMNYSAVRLFLQSARRLQPGFELQPTDLKYVARITREVQGLPLGIVLAASWIEMLSLAEIATEIEKNIDFLESEQRDLPERQRSIRAVFEYSWNLLTVAEQDAFKRLSVFRGGFTRDAAQKAAGASLRILMGLVNKSLLRRSPTGRYEIHELLRQYAQSRLTPDELEEAEHAQTDYIIGMLEQNGLTLDSPDRAMMNRVIEEEWDNIRVAWLHLIQHQNAQAIRTWIYPLALLCLGKDRYVDGEMMGHKAAEAMQNLPKTDRDAQIALGQSLAVWGFFAACNEDNETARQKFNDGEAVLFAADAEIELADAVTLRGMVRALFETNLGLTDTEIFERVKQYGSVSDKTNNQWSRAGYRFVLSALSLQFGRIEEAETYARESRAIFDQSGDTISRAFGDFALGWVSYAKHDLASAYHYYTLAAQTYEKTGTRSGQSYALMQMAHAAFMMGKTDLAVRHLQAGITIQRAAGDRRGVMYALFRFGEFAEQTGHFDMAESLYTEARNVSQQIGKQDISAAGLLGLSRIAARKKQLSASLKMIQDALPTLSSHDLVFRQIEAVASYALYCLYRGDAERAAALALFAFNHPRSAFEQRPLFAAFVEIALVTLSEQQKTLAQQRASKMDLATVLTEIRETR